MRRVKLVLQRHAGRKKALNGPHLNATRRPEKGRAGELQHCSRFPELLYGARLRADKPALMTAVRAFLARVTVHPWDDDAAEQHALIRATAKAQGRSAGVFDIMIAAHARALGATLVTSDAAIAKLGVDGLQVVNWRG